MQWPLQKLSPFSQYAQLFSNVCCKSNSIKLPTYLYEEIIIKFINWHLTKIHFLNFTLIKPRNHFKMHISLNKFDLSCIEVHFSDRLSQHFNHADHMMTYVPPQNSTDVMEAPGPMGSSTSCFTSTPTDTTLTGSGYTYIYRAYIQCITYHNTQ